MTVPIQSARLDPGCGLALGAAGRDDAAPVEGPCAADQHPQLVVAQEHHVIGDVQPPRLDQLASDRHQHQADVGVRALVDVEVVVRRQWRHAEVDLVGRAHLLERLAGQALEDLGGGGLDVAAHRRDRGGEVVVAGEVVAHEVERRLHVLAHGREDELVAPHRVPAELALVGLDPLGDEPAAAIGRMQGARDRRPVARPERLAELGVVADLVLHPPQGLDRVPVAVRGRVLETAQQRLVDGAARPLHHRPQVERRGQLREVQHPVDLPVPIVDVDRVLEHAGDLGQRHAISGVELVLEVREVALHLGHQAVAPPVREVEAVDGQHRVEVGAHRTGERGVARDPGPVARAVLRAVDPQVGVGRDRRRVDVAVDVLGQPVDGERRAEPPEHVVAAQPPAADVEEHRAHGVGDVEVVVDPEQVPLGVRGPVHRERVVAEELAQDLLRRAHWLGPPTPAPRTAGDRQSFDHR